MVFSPWDVYLMHNVSKLLSCSLVPRLLFTKQENSLINKLLWFRYFEITMMSHQLDFEFKSALVLNSELGDSLLMLLSIDTIA